MSTHFAPAGQEIAGMDASSGNAVWRESPEGSKKASEEAVSRVLCAMREAPRGGHFSTGRVATPL